MPHQTKQTGHTFTSLMIHQMLTTNTFNLAPQSVTTHHSTWYQSIDNHATLPCLTISPPPILPQLKPTCMSSLSHLIKNYWKLLKTEKQLDICTKNTEKDCLTISPAPIFPRLKPTCFTCSLSHFLFKAH